MARKVLKGRRHFLLGFREAFGGGDGQKDSMNGLWDSNKLRRKHQYYFSCWLEERGEDKNQKIRLIDLCVFWSARLKRFSGIHSKTCSLFICWTKKKFNKISSNVSGPQHVFKLINLAPAAKLFRNFPQWSNFPFSMPPKNTASTSPQLNQWVVAFHTFAQPKAATTALPLGSHNFNSL